jgi:hypothetical protein
MIGFGILRIILAMFGRPTKTGFLALAAGNHVVEIKTGWTPSYVWIDFGKVCDVPTCGGGEDTFDVKIIKHGFILTASIHSNCRHIKWFAIK